MGIKLTGNAAKAFQQQFIDNPRKDNKRSQAALDRGLARMDEFKRTGKIIFKVLSQ